MYTKKNVKQSLSGNIPTATAFTAASCRRRAMELCPGVLGCELLVSILAELLVRWFAGKSLGRDSSSNFSALCECLFIEAGFCLALLTTVS